ncbi:hypothetical protein DHEL01_v210034 [Diaporthe helianthi]|uniref:Uncharacterized protein n=1 Tax=Diaporthe helianthi TaxID=158607 RepID=A0A2P5HMT7_DIAHE|nr:hypothetical protein DHEL01_v210034 [Diaporthe helianthi]
MAPNVPRLRNTAWTSADAFRSPATGGPPIQSLKGASRKIKYSENIYDGRGTTLAQALDGTPNPPTPPETGATPKPRRGKVAELKKAFERGLSDLVRKRQVTRPSDSSTQSNAKHPQHPRHQVAVAHTSSPEGSLSRASVFCSPFPKPRRETDGLPSPLKERISIFEGLVKPSSFQSSATDFRPEEYSAELNRGSISKGAMVLEGASNEPMSRLPSKFRGGAARRRFHKRVEKEKKTLGNTSKTVNSQKRFSEVGTAVRDSLEQLHVGRTESGHSSAKRTGEPDSPKFLKRVSSTFKQRHKPSQQPFLSSRGSRVSGGFETEKSRNTSKAPQSTSQNEEPIQTDKRRTLAADSLRKRLESELRSPTGADTSDHPARDEADPRVYNRRKTTLWDIENPFDVPKAKDRSKSEATGVGLGKKGGRLPGHTKSHDFTFGQTFGQAVRRQKAPASRYTQPIEQPQTGSESPGRDSSGPVTEDSGSSDFMVVANAQCELTHPRPSRSSEQTMIKVLCKAGPETAETQGSSGQLTPASVSEGSTASFHTAHSSTDVF